jgi:hypothetical protein
MKLWYDDKKIPLWVEWLAVVATGFILAVLFVAFI